MRFSVRGIMLRTFLLGGDKMADYKKMYLELFNGITDVIEQLKKLQFGLRSASSNPKRKRKKRNPNRVSFFDGC